jgi:hypothetical protein
MVIPLFIFIFDEEEKGSKTLLGSGEEGGVDSGEDIGDDGIFIGLVGLLLPFSPLDFLFISGETRKKEKREERDLGRII